MKAVIQIVLINFIVYSVTYLMEINGLYLNNLLALFPLNSEHFSAHQLVTHIILNTNDDVGHLAHILGASFGILYFLKIRKKHTEI